MSFFFHRLSEEIDIYVPQTIDGYTLAMFHERQFFSWLLPTHGSVGGSSIFKVSGDVPLAKVYFYGLPVWLTVYVLAILVIEKSNFGNFGETLFRNVYEGCLRAHVVNMKIAKEHLGNS